MIRMKTHGNPVEGKSLKSLLNNNLTVRNRANSRNNSSLFSRNEHNKKNIENSYKNKIDKTKGINT